MREKLRYFRNHKIALALVLSAAVFFVSVSLATINKWSIWHDESYTHLLVSDSPSEIIRRTGYDVHPPLYYLVLKGWAEVFGYNVAVMRSFSLLTLAIGLGLLVIFTWKKFGPKVAALTAWLLATNGSMIRYSQEMRMYGMAILLVIAASILFYELLKKPTRMKQLGYAVLLAAIAYTQYFVTLVAIAHVIAWFVHTRKQDKQSSGWLEHAWKTVISDTRITVSFLGAAVLFSVWIPTLLRQVSEVQNGFWIGFASHNSFINALSYGFTLMPEYDLLHWYSLVAFLTIGSTFVMIRRTVKEQDATPKEKSRATWVKYALLLYFVPQIVLYFISLPPFQSFFHERYTIATLPFFVVALAYSAVRSWSHYPRARYFVAVLFVAIASLGVYRASSWGTSTNWNSRDYFAGKSFFEFTESKKRDGDVYLATSLWTYFDARYYHEVECNHEVLLFERFLEPYKYGNMSLMYDRKSKHVNSLDDARLSGKRVWIFDEMQPKVSVPSNWQQLEKQTKGYGSVTLYQVPDTQPVIVN